MVEKMPEIKKEQVFEISCTECGHEFKVFITPTADTEIAMEELKKIQETKLCPNCRK